MEGLFGGIDKNKKPRKPFVKTQQHTCKRCKGSTHEGTEAYCNRFDLCIEFDNGNALLAKNGQKIQCDGKNWSY